MSEKICRWNDKVNCEETKILTDDSNRANPLPRDFLYCTECLLREAITSLNEFNKLDFTKRNRNFMLQYAKLIGKAEILNSQWREYWKEQERRVREGLR